MESSPWGHLNICGGRLPGNGMPSMNSGIDPTQLIVKKYFENPR
jgi:hypothetical protein